MRCSGKCRLCHHRQRPSARARSVDRAAGFRARPDPLARATSGRLRAHRRARRPSTARPSSSPTRAAWSSALPMRSASAWARKRYAPTTGASLARPGWEPNRASRRVRSRWWWPRLHWSSESTWAMSIWCVIWAHRARLPSWCSGSGAPGTSWVRLQRACCSLSPVTSSSSAPPPFERFEPGPSIG